MDVVGGEVGQGAAAAVLELHPAGASRRCGQAWVAAAQGLQLRLLVGTDHVVVGAERLTVPATVVQVQHGAGLGAEVGVAGEDPGPVLPGLDRVCGQPAAHRGRADRGHQALTDGLGDQFGDRPAGQRHACVRWWGAGQGLDLDDLHRGEAGRAPRTGSIREAVESVLAEPPAPFADGVDVQTQLGGDRRVGIAVRGGQHDSGANNLTMLGPSRAGSGGEDGLVGGGQDNHEGGKRSP